jgi:hypothetical protein
MIEYRREDEAEEKKERNMGKEKNGPGCSNRKPLHVKQVAAVFIFIT